MKFDVVVPAMYRDLKGKELEKAIKSPDFNALNLIPEEYRGLQVTVIFGSTKFSAPGLIETQLEQISNNLRKLGRGSRHIIGTGINGAVAKTAEAVVASLHNLHLLRIGPDMTGIYEKMGSYATHQFERTVVADELLLATGNAHFAFTAKTPNTSNMIMSCRHVHKKGKTLMLIEDPAPVKATTISERIQLEMQRQHAQHA